MVTIARFVDEISRHGRQVQAAHLGTTAAKELQQNYLDAAKACGFAVPDFVHIADGYMGRLFGVAVFVNPKAEPDSVRMLP